MNIYVVIKKQTCNSHLNNKRVIEINFMRYYKVVTYLLQRANIGTATERLQSSVIKIGAVWKNI